MGIQTARGGIIRLRDGTAVTPKTFDFTFDGEFSRSGGGTKADFHDDRGALPAVPEQTLNKDEPIKLTFNCKVKAMTSDTEFVPNDLVTGLNGRGFVLDEWVSTVTDSPTLLVDVMYLGDSDNWEVYSDCHFPMAPFKEGFEANTLNLEAICPHPYPTVEAYTP